MNLTKVDWAVMAIYFVFVLGIGVWLRRSIKTSTDFFLSGRSIPAWITGLAFISANLGAQEVIGMGANGAKYGIATSHFYWIGAIPAMVFVGIFMMPFYYGSKVRSVPEYLKVRFDEKTRGFNALTFAVMTVLLVRHLAVRDGPVAEDSCLDWDFNVSVWVVGGDRAGLHLSGRTHLGHLQRSAAVLSDRVRLLAAGVSRACATSAAGAAWSSGSTPSPPVERLRGRRVDRIVATHEFASRQSDGRRMVRHGDGAGLRAVVRLLVHRLSGRAAGDGGRFDVGRTPHAADRRRAQDVFPIPGDPARHDRHRAHAAGRPERLRVAQGSPTARLNYNMATPMMLLHYFPTGMLGIGLTALMASFMSGMAGNVTAFNTVWTYDIYQPYIHRKASDQHYLWMGRMATIFGIAISVAAAYVATAYNNIMDMLQLVFAFVNAPLFATFLLGMFWKRTTGHGAFLGLLSGTLAAAIHHGLTLPKGATVGIKGGWFGRSSHCIPARWPRTFWTAIFAWTTCFVVTIVVSLVTKPRPDKRTGRPRVLAHREAQGRRRAVVRHARRRSASSCS